MQLSGMARPFTIQIAGQRFDGERGTEDVLAEVIMHFLANPPLLPLGGIEKRMFQKFTFRYVPQQQMPLPIP
jgi:hypothetical protein